MFTILVHTEISRYLEHMKSELSARLDTTRGECEKPVNNNLGELTQ